VHFNLNFYDFWVIAIYFLLSLILPTIIGKIQKTTDDSQDEYFMAGRRLTLPVFVATLVSTWYGSIFAVSEMAYKHGLGEWLCQGVFWYIAYFIFVFFYIKKIREKKFFTIPEILENKFGRKTSLLGAFVILILQSPVTYIISMALIAQMIFGLPMWLSAFVGLIVPLIYTFNGGFKADIYTDCLQFVLMFIGIAIVLPFTINHFGFDYIVSNFPAGHLKIGGEIKFEIIIAWALIACWTFIDTGFYQRTLAAKSLETAQRGVLIAIVFWVIFDLMICFLGILAFIVLPNTDARLALPNLANMVLPNGLKGLFIVGVLSTVMSTFDSLLFSSAMCFTKDIYQKYFKTNDSNHLIKVNKIAMLLVALFAFVASLNCHSLIKFMYYKGSIGISALFLPLSLALLAPEKINSRKAFRSIVCGLLACISTITLKELHLIDIEPAFIGLGFSALGLLL